MERSCYEFKIDSPVEICDEINKRKGLRREFREEFKKDQKEFETYSNEKVEKGFASPLR